MAASVPLFEQPRLRQAGDDLFDYAVDREDLKWLLARVPETDALKRPKVEYELQLLKIISVGWSIAYYLPPGEIRSALSEHYWEAVRRLSRSLSESAGLMVGQDIDYFATIKERLDSYVRVLARNPGQTEPARLIGPEFSRLCGDADDLFAFMAGSKMFLYALQRVHSCLKAVGLPDTA